MQGAFGAVLVSSTKSLLVTVYKEEHERAKVLGVFTATLTAGLAVGLVLGGVITSGLGWRWCLYLNVIFSAFVVIGAPRVLPQLPRRPEVRIDVVERCCSPRSAWSASSTASARRPRPDGARPECSAPSWPRWSCWAGSSSASSATPTGYCPCGWSPIATGAWGWWRWS